MTFLKKGHPLGDLLILIDLISHTQPDRTTRYDRTTYQWKQDTWNKTVSNTSRRGVSESLIDNHRPEFWEGEQTEPVGSQEMCETVSSGQWIKRVTWNRMTIKPMREQPHTTPVTTTWTIDFLTRVGEDRKVMGNWSPSVTEEHNQCFQ